jgi:hypothetical protein
MVCSLHILYEDVYCPMSRYRDQKRHVRHMRHVLDSCDDSCNSAKRSGDGDNVENEK